MQILTLLLTLLVIMSTSCTLKEASNIKNKKILFVLTSHDKLGESGEKTGSWLAEITHPYHELISKGFEIDFVSPQGGKAPIDQRSFDLDDPINKEFLENKDTASKINNTLKPSDVDPKDYSAIFYAGGHGTMWDFPDNSILSKIAASIYEAGGIVSAVCHGPAALLNLKLSDGKHLIEGKTLAAYTNEEEEAGGDEVPFFLETELIKKSAKHTKAGKYQPHVVVSERLVTGQNPASAQGVGKEIAKLLQ